MELPADGTVDRTGGAPASRAAESAPDRATNRAGDSAPPPRLDVRDLKVRLGPGGGTPIVHSASFRIAPGRTLALVGASGSGKTTIGRAILRLVPIAGGQVRLDGIDLAGLRGSALRDARRGMQMIWQDPAGSLNPRMRIGDQVAEPLRVHGLAGGRDARSRAADLLERCGLPADAAGRFPAAFSGGQRQRIAIARALILEPGLLVCDEPTSALDVHVRQGIMDLLAEVQAERGLSMLFITHDLPLVRGLDCDIAVLDGGRIVEMGGPEVADRPEHPVSQALVEAIPANHPRASRILSRAGAGSTGVSGGPVSSVGGE